jgi:iron complex outermembrane receptor protein
LNDELTYRTYMQGFLRDAGGDREGLEASDDWREGRVGLRLDWSASEADLVTFAGEYYRGVFGQTLLLSDPTVAAQWPGTIAEAEDLRAHGLYAMVDWRHTLAPNSYWSLRASYQQEDREEISLDDRRNKYTIEFSHRFPLLDGRHDIFWGTCYDLVRDHLLDTETIRFSSERDEIQTYCAFVQDEIALIPERLTLTLGSRFELTDRNGWESQPSARLAFMPTPRQTWWVAVSRAVRVPSRMEFTGGRWLTRGLTLVDGSVYNYTARFCGSPNLDPEQLLAYEFGSRFLIGDSTSLDLAVYYHDFSDSVALVYAGSDIGADYVDDRYVVDNALDVSVYGFEAALRYRPRDWWQVDIAYTFMRVQMHPHGGAPHLNEDWYEKDAPKHQLSVLSSFRVSPTATLNLWARYVDSINDVGGYETNAYVTLDANVRWQVTPRCALTVAGRNLLDSDHTEYYPSTLLPTASTAMQRALYVELSYRF